MNRRQFFKVSLLGGGVFIGGGATVFIKSEDESRLVLSEALKKLDDLSNKHILHLGDWDPSQIFIHCAQSVEYSMLQFPEHKSKVFQGTVGQLAFMFFSSKGRMIHSLNEPIPGAPVLVANSNYKKSLTRLKNSLIAFDNYQGVLAPHFAYGELSKDEYIKAHVMHLYNHLEEITI